jgi:hypothetical protein
MASTTPLFQERGGDRVRELLGRLVTNTDDGHSLQVTAALADIDQPSIGDKIQKRPFLGDDTAYYFVSGVEKRFQLLCSEPTRDWIGRRVAWHAIFFIEGLAVERRPTRSTVPAVDGSSDVGVGGSRVGWRSEKEYEERIILVVYRTLVPWRREWALDDEKWFIQVQRVGGRVKIKEEGSFVEGVIPVLEWDRDHRRRTKHNREIFRWKEAATGSENSWVTDTDDGPSLQVTAEGDGMCD